MFPFFNIIFIDLNDDDEWGGYTIKATSTEIDSFNIEQLLERMAYAKRTDTDPIYIAVCESYFLADEWRRLVSRSESNSIDPSLIDIWNKDNLRVVIPNQQRAHRSRLLNSSQTLAGLVYSFGYSSI